MDAATATAPTTSSTRSRRCRTSLTTGAIAVTLLAGLALPGTAAATPAHSQPPSAVVSAANPLTTPAVATQAGRPRNGAVLTKRGSGSGSFTVDNSRGGDDAAITLADGARAVLVLYVRAGEKATATKIPNGSFDVFTERGQNWSSASGRFDRTSSAGRFDRRAGFSTERTSRGTRYTKVTLTLHQVPSGNTRVTPVADASVPS